MTVVRVSGEVDFYHNDEVIVEELLSNLDRVKTAFTFTPDYGVPEVSVSEGTVLVVQGTTPVEVSPVGTITLVDNSVNYIYAGLDNADPALYADTTQTGPAFPAIQIGTVNTSTNSESPASATSNQSIDAKTVTTEFLNTETIPTVATVWLDDNDDTVGINQLTGEQYGPTFNSASVLNAIMNDLYDGTSGGGRIMLGEGRFVCQSPVQIRENCWLEGQSIRGTQLWLASGTDDNLVELIPQNGSTDEHFGGLSHMILLGNSANNTTGHLLYSDVDDGGFDHKDFHCKSVWFEDAPEDGLRLNNAWGYRFTDMLSEHCGGNGMYVNSNQWHTSNLWLTENDGHGLHIGTDATIGNLDVVCHRNGGHGVFVDDALRLHGQIDAQSNDQTGVFFDGAQCNLSILSRDNSKGSAGTYYNLHSKATDSTVVVWLGGGANITDDLYLHLGGDNMTYWGKVGSVKYGTANAEHRSILNGFATNDGDPDSAGSWNGITPNDGVVIRDETNGRSYLYDARLTGGRIEVPSAVAQTYTPSNVTTDRTFDADSTTTAELGDVLGTLIDDLQTAGVID